MELFQQEYYLHLILELLLRVLGLELMQVGHTL